MLGGALTTIIVSFIMGAVRGARCLLWRCHTVSDHSVLAARQMVGMSLDRLPAEIAESLKTVNVTYSD